MNKNKKQKSLKDLLGSLDFIKKEALRHIPYCVFGEIQTIEKYAKDIKKYIRDSYYKNRKSS